MPGVYGTAVWFPQVIQMASLQENYPNHFDKNSAFW